VRQLIEAHTAATEVTVAWQGEEPTMMGLGFFRRSVELAERHRRPGQRIVYTIQTNGTLLDDGAPREPDPRASSQVRNGGG
jgi:uncharacterized protein